MKKTLLIALLALPFSLALAADIAPNVSREVDATQFLIPVAGNVPGANGEHFRTHLTIVNYRDVAQSVDLTWIPQGGAPLTKRLTIPFLTNLTFADVVGAHIGASGLGSILVTAVLPSGETDPAGVIDGSARIWTPAPRGGEISSFVAGMLLDGWRNDSPAYVHGTRRTSQSRTSYGIVNLDRAAARSFRVIVNSGLGRFEETVTLEPLSMTQRPVSNVYGDLSVYVEPLGAGGAWRAYGSSTDNESRSSWIVPAMQPRSDIVFP